MLSYYYELFELSEKYTIEELKKAYRKLVKQHHPDLFKCNHQKKFQEVKMAQINEAFIRLKDQLTSHNENISPLMNNLKKNTMQLLAKDNSYYYYKKGFIFFTKAINKKYHKVGVIVSENSIKCFNIEQFSDENIKNDYINSFKLLRLADYYFSIVINDYPKSIWSNDAISKLKEIERFYNLYQKILNNINSSPNLNPSI